MSKRNLMNIETTGYAVGINTTPQTVTLTADDTTNTTICVYNASSSSNIWVLAGQSGVTAAIPAAGSSARGKLIPPQTMLSWAKSYGGGYVSVIADATDASKNAYVWTGEGE